jgi:hypothetical protein
MYTVKRLRQKISPLEDKEFTEKLIPLLAGADYDPYMRQFRGKRCVMITPREAWTLAYPTEEPNLHDLTNIGRSLQAMLWERSYLRGNLVFTKTLQEIDEDGF